MTAAPERILVDGRIFLRGIEGEPVEGLAVTGGRVRASGTGDAMRALAGRDTEVESLEGAFATPGFHDAHCHLAAGALALADLDLRGCNGAEEVAARVRAAAAGLPPGRWIRGWGWDHLRWPGATWPERTVLDRAAPRHPVFLSRVDGHVAWLSSRALAEVGIDAATPDPEGGVIVRGRASREATGILLERARDMALDRLPEAKVEERRWAVEAGLERLRGVGVTSVEDVTAPWALEAYAGLRETGRLTARVSAWLPLEHDREEAEALRRRFPADDSTLAVGTLKVFLDGTLGSRTAAVLEPYADDPPNRGDLRVDPAWLGEQVVRADADGWAVAMHAIGDRAVRLAVDVLEALPARSRPRPHRIEHVQMIAERDRARMAACGAVASIQPVHYAEDRPWIERRLGPDRAAAAYPWRSLISRGVPLAIGTDWPVAPLDPLRGLHAAVQERPEALTLEQAWRAYTLGPARAAGRDVELGTLEPGCCADLVVLSDDPRSTDPDRIRVTRTYLGGRRIHPV